MYLTYDKMLHVSSVKIYAAFQKKVKIEVVEQLLMGAN